MSTQPVIQGYSHLNCHQQSKQSQTGAVTMKQRRQYLEAPKSEQHGLNGRVTCGQWLTGEQCHDCVNEVKSYNLDTQRSETHVIPTPRILCKQLQTGRTVFSPLSVFPHPEPMYHYSQISPAMSSMHQQQILHVQCHSRPLLYKPTPYFGRQITSIDGGYCSMNQDSVREDDPEVTDPQ
ncbi:hypothetical protein KIN20_022069 [Parelaphostrongylus tenuis]|uniref:Uncharacterized protein n=1 Tax=Parelaphostrongylus tenuis TaxID=148309 RepID=A0AAD5QUY9_PARTN|nr:hypothetical protein KIN20_022069 [Parelaphostrongylus tenuis]